MRHGSTAARQLKIFFIRNQHDWVDFSNGRDYIRVRCKDCGLIAMQDLGSLGYFVGEGDSDIASLNCDELIIKFIIE
jgi:hypothetical protein